MLAAAALSISSSGVALPASSSRALLPSSRAAAASPSWRAAAASSSRSPLHAARMEMQEIEFIIYPDGRVEERVIGVKGENCQQLTAKLNEALGEDAPQTVSEEAEPPAMTDEGDTTDESMNSDAESMDETEGEAAPQQ